MRTVDPAEWSKKVKKSLPKSSFGKQGDGGFESLLRRSFILTCKEYAKNCSVKGVRAVGDEHELHIESIVYRIVFILLFLNGIITIGLVVYWTQTQASVGVTLPFLEHSIDEIYFPAVAICSYNLLSKQALENYAKELYHNDTRKRKKYTEREIYNELVKFGSLVDHSLPEIDSSFTQFLQRVDSVRGHNMTELMLTFATPCEKQLVHCSWHGEPKDCNELFALRLTPVGFCCNFNSRYHEEDWNNEPKLLNVVGQDLGLSVVVKRMLDDYAYIRRPTVGSEVMIFDGSEYPLLEAGAVKSYPTFLNVSAYFVLSTSEQHARDNVRNIPPKRRKCIFKVESGPRNSMSSYAWCLTMCRRDAIQQLCGCVPFYLMPDPDSFICTMSQIACLNKYREKILVYYPPTESHDVSLKEELVDSLDCPQCKPDCQRTRYTAAVYTSRYYDGKRIFKNYFTRNVTLGNTTVIRVFYTTEDQKLFLLEVTQRLQETISMFGGELMTVLGVTFLVLPELIFHFTLQWGRHYRRLKTRKFLQPWRRTGEAA